MQLARTKEWRESRGLTQRRLAAEAGVGEVTVARVETGSSVTPPTARKLADALGVSVADLLERPPVPLMAIEPGNEPEEGLPATRIYHDVLAPGLMDRVQRGELSVDEAMVLVEAQLRSVASAAGSRE
jgi:transcriptional regulator with XRE-family HTH domain